MKTAVSIPDDLFEQADRLADRLNTSRSAIYAQALAEFLARHDADEVTALMNRTIDEAGPVDTSFTSAAAQHTLQETEW